jgi:hypothetical protein
MVGNVREPGGEGIAPASEFVSRDASGEHESTVTAEVVALANVRGGAGHAWLIGERSSDGALTLSCSVTSSPAFHAT